jgi:hypothetical protein
MRFVSLSLLVLLVAACARKDVPASVPTKAPALAAAASVDVPSAAPVTGAAPAFSTVSGVVQETLGASDYTYMRLKTADGEIWAAVTMATVTKGQQVTVINAMPMDGFESKTLNRRFERIVFGTLSEPGSAATAANPHAAPGATAPMAAGHEPVHVGEAREQMKAQHAAAAAGPADVGKIDVKKAEGPDGKTVAEIFAAKGTLKGKEAAVRGKVVKYTPGVMGKNWIHLRDGSGGRDQKNDDLTITTAETTALGEVVLVRGTVRLDVDFGSGYSYPVLIENAKLAK